MAKCITCVNDYGHTFDVKYEGRTMTFDCIECAAQAIAPVCGQCSCRVLGHGVEQDGTIYCCSSCAHAWHLATPARTSRVSRFE